MRRYLGLEPQPRQYLIEYTSDSLHTHKYLLTSLSNYMSILLQRLELKAKLFRGFADSTRLSILEYLRNGEKTSSQIVKEVNQSQPNVSNHLACLLDCGLVKNRRQGRNIFYSLRNKKVSNMLQETDSILSEIASGIYACVNYKE